MIIKFPRISDPKEKVDVQFTDMGDVRPAYDKNGNAYEVYTSRFEWNDQLVENYVDRNMAEYHGMAKYRYQQDCAFLEKYDLCLAKGSFE